MSDEDLKSDLAQNMEYVGVAEDSGFASISGAVPVNGKWHTISATFFNNRMATVFNYFLRLERIDEYQDKENKERIWQLMHVCMCTYTNFNGFDGFK